MKMVFCFSFLKLFTEPRRNDAPFLSIKAIFCIQCPTTQSKENSKLLNSRSSHDYQVSVVYILICGFRLHHIKMN